MKVIKKVNLNLLLTLCVVCISMLHPMTVNAADGSVGGLNNKATVSTTVYYEFNGSNFVKNISWTYVAKDDYEIVGVLLEDRIQLWWVKGGKSGSLSVNHLSDYVGYDSVYNIDSSEYDSLHTYQYGDGKTFANNIYFTVSGQYGSYKVEGMKLFADVQSALDYAESGSLDGMIKDELDKTWYLQDIGYKVDADDSPASEAGEDATYITFTWSNDNLQEGDLLEIKTHNYLKKIGGDQISGYHDYITHFNNVSAYSGKYRFSQYDATKSWFSTLDNKPMIFKSYDTDVYYLRPYRNGVYGGWVKITIGRSPVIKGSPYVEDIEYGDFDEDDDWVTDEKITEKEGGHHGVNQNGTVFYPDTDNPFEGTNVTGIFKWFFDFMKEIPSFLGDLPALVGSIIGFLPSQIIGFIALGLVVAIILRIVGR